MRGFCWSPGAACKASAASSVGKMKHSLLLFIFSLTSTIADDWVRKDKRRHRKVVPDSDRQAARSWFNAARVRACPIALKTLS